MKLSNIAVLPALLVVLTGWAAAQSAATPGQQSQGPTAPPPASLHLNNITPPKKIQFPPVDPKNFTAPSPTAQDVNAFLRQLWGYDPNRVWQVAAIQSTKAPNVSRVTVAVAEQGVSHSPAATVFFVTPDGHHAIAGGDVIAFGADPFGTARRELAEGATGPSQGASSKNLLVVEFADLQCPHCAEAAATINHLATDFPSARIVFENFPLTNLHPAAQQAAEYGVCVAEQKGNAAFFQYVQAVFDTQAGLTANAEQTLKAAATKAGADAAQVSVCAASPAAKAKVATSVKLGDQLGVDQTPFLFVNGRPIPVNGVPYNVLKQIVTYSASESSPAAAASK